jgi:large subunit ribosomal protein L24
VKVKKGDNVKILSGKDRGTISEIITVFPSTRKVLVKGVNIVTKHQKSKGENKPGGRIKFELPIDVSNVQVIDPVSSKPSRVGFEIVDGKKKRIFKVGKLVSSKKVETKKENKTEDKPKAKTTKKITKPSTKK